MKTWLIAAAWIGVAGFTHSATVAHWNFEPAAGGLALDAAWTAGDADNENYTIDLYWTDRNYVRLTPQASKLPKGQNRFVGVAPIPLDRQFRLHAVVTDAKGTMTQVSSWKLNVQNVADPNWLLCP
jgi:hypothetical protein